MYFLGPCPQNRMSSRLVSLIGSAPFKKPGPSADFDKVKGRELPKRDTDHSVLKTGPKISKAKTRSCTKVT